MDCAIGDKVWSQNCFCICLLFTNCNLSATTNSNPVFFTLRTLLVMVHKYCKDINSVTLNSFDYFSLVTQYYLVDIWFTWTTTSVSGKMILFQMVRLLAQGGNRNLDINPLTVFAFFVSCCRQNLHIVLSLSSISYSFRRWLSLYPSLLNHCTIDWVEVSYIVSVATFIQN